MGNVREIRQIHPSPRRVGVAIPIRDGCGDLIAEELDGYPKSHFYTYIAPIDKDHTIWNMGHASTSIGTSKLSRFIIQSGGKMWCGYDAFCEHISILARYLEDAIFFVGDEEDYIDEFNLQAGELDRKRVHSGGWRQLTDYLRERHPDGEW